MDKQAENSRIFILLLDILSKSIFSKKGSELIVDMDADTLELLCRKAEEHRLGILLYYYCRQYEILPELWMDKWSVEFRTMSANELRQADELKSIYKILTENDIEFAPLKGAYLAYNYYPHPALRNMSDFDILIRPKNIEKAFQVMLDNNFTSTYDFGSLHHEPQLKSPRGFVLELHSHISPNPKRCPADALWEGCRKAEFRAQEITCLSPEISLLHVINHALKDHLIGGLKGVIDVAYIFAGGNINVKKLEHCARKNGFYDEFTLFMNIFPTFFPGKYLPAFEQFPDTLLEDARYLIYNSRNAQEMDEHQIMLYREYDELSFFKKLLFMSKRMNVKAVSIASTYKCRPYSPMLIYYYFHRACTYFIKLVLFEKSSKQSSLTRNIGICQKKIHSYLYSSARQVKGS
ncbi:MAG: nucleotidyltransferase family protein [Victivallales bacterium]|nr:nucleotidyltransferase family protein [Victivallales bacterium]